MDINNEHVNFSQRKSKRATNRFFLSSNYVAIYTTLSILNKMKDKLGLEAMLEYVDEYLTTVNQHDQSLTRAVGKALSMISIEKMFKRAVADDDIV